ncbi:hypothetical protein L1987_23364 [Smallanthus sonchifolius]|uniref:Uncharacterized protein n=1 Tax=Smallanthus sonchifolius TaxID=185202 RepID=A0ACB9IIX4_9ASTR|nr:hypothetical protein L1987_23364 [Smallanthus sonchifolius]
MVIHTTPKWNHPNFRWRKITNLCHRVSVKAKTVGPISQVTNPCTKAAIFDASQAHSRVREKRNNHFDAAFMNQQTSVHTMEETKQRDTLERCLQKDNRDTKPNLRDKEHAQAKPIFAVQELKGMNEVSNKKSYSQ